MCLIHAHKIKNNYKISEGSIKRARVYHCGAYFFLFFFLFFFLPIFFFKFLRFRD